MPEDPQIDKSKEADQQKDKFVRELTAFIRNEIVPKEKQPQGIRIDWEFGGWYPSWHKDEEGVVGFLCSSFSELADEVKRKDRQKPIFLDLGSGDGMVTAIAAGTQAYSRVYGIENMEPLSDWSRENIKKLEDLGTIPSNLVEIVTGTYYTRDRWNKITEGYKTRTQKDLGLPPKFGLEEGSLLDSDGKLKADVIFWYPSDPLVKEGAFQWSEIMRPGTLLVLSPSGQIDDLESVGLFEDYEPVVIKERPGVEAGQLPNLFIYRKK